MLINNGLCCMISSILSVLCHPAKNINKREAGWGSGKNLCVGGGSRGRDNSLTERAFRNTHNVLLQRFQ